LPTGLFRSDRWWGHAHVEVSDQQEGVENDDWASYAVDFANGATGNLSASRVAFGHPNTLKFEVFFEQGRAGVRREPTG
jgi:predicted dehydrogenase